jgi:eukaryotic-like serine/threonine-protein kinase
VMPAAPAPSSLAPPAGSSPPPPEAADPVGPAPTSDLVEPPTALPRGRRARMVAGLAAGLCLPLVAVFVLDLGPPRSARRPPTGRGGTPILLDVEMVPPPTAPAPPVRMASPTLPAPARPKSGGPAPGARVRRRLVRSPPPAAALPRPRVAATAAAAAAEPSGYLSLDSAPWSNVFLGERLLGATPIIRVALPPGRHVLRLANPEIGASTSYVVEIESTAAISRFVGWAKQ